MKIFNKRIGFSLIETMMSLLILSVILAAALPVVTIRTNSTSSSGGDGYWKSINNTDIYYAEGGNQGVIIGSDTLIDNAKLEVHGTNDVPQLLVKAYSTQTNPIFKVTDSSNSSLLEVVDDGNNDNSGLIVSPQEAIGIEGGQIKLQGANTYDDWNLDSYREMLRFYSNGVPFHEFSPSGDLYKIQNVSRVAVFKVTDTGDVIIKNESAAPLIEFLNDSDVQMGAIQILDKSVGTTNTGNNYAFGEGNFASIWNGASDNIAIGQNALSSINLAQYNVGIGNNALNSVVSGHRNTAIGHSAGAYTTGSGNVFIGRGAGPSTPSGVNGTGSDELYIHNAQTSLALIYGDFANGKVTINGDLRVNGDIDINNGSNTSTGLYKRNSTTLSDGMSSWSDIRLKNILSDYKHGLEEISKLKTFEFKFKKDNKLKLDSEKEHVGIVAQDLQKVMPEAVEEGKDGYLKIDKDRIFYAMVNSIQELKKENDKLRAEIKEIKQYLDMPIKKENKKSWWQCFMDW